MDVCIADENARLARLYELAILDTAPEQIYEDVVALAAQICDMPIAIINFVDADRQWGKALIGLASSEAPRDASFCARTIQQDDGLLIVPDTRADPDWAENPQVTGTPGLRFYAGAAIVTEDGYALGSVCVADNAMPRQLNAGQIDALRILARQTASHLQLRRQSVELAGLTARLREMAIKDALTGLPNRVFFHQSLELALHQRGSGQPGLLFCDMNGFKQVNDRFGHHAGDELLQIVAARLSSAARQGDLVARLAGDEFVVLCPGIEDPTDLEDIATRLSEAVAQPADVAGHLLTPAVTVGAALAHPDETPDALLQRADAAMYRDKPSTRSALRV